MRYSEEVTKKIERRVGMNLGAQNPDCEREMHDRSFNFIVVESMPPRHPFSDTMKCFVRGESVETAGVREWQ